MSDHISPIGFMQSARASRQFVNSLDAISAGLREDRGEHFDAVEHKALYAKEQYPHGMLSAKPPTPFEAMRNEHAKRIKNAGGSNP